ncbi:zinc finger protein Xfin-like isoform X2 [Cydia splendana]|uniref:zinc finger protein Xfin-like isoform X2 n=1 Tax=Cydia splendana TaxID=1100963 RepID=UPI0028F465D6
MLIPMSLEGENFEIKVEPGWGTGGELEAAQAMYTDHETEKLDPQPGQLDEIKFEPDWTIEDSKINESVAAAGLYVDHIFKEEIVLGPEVIEQPKLSLPYPGYCAACSPTVPMWPKTNKEKTFYKCHACRKTFGLEDSLTRHIFAVHAKNEIPKINKVHVCKFCCQMFLSKNGLAEHLMVHFKSSRNLKENVFINKRRNILRRDKIIPLKTLTSNTPSYNITPPGSKYVKFECKCDKTACTEDKDCCSSNIKPYTCHACHVSFVLEKSFDKHMLDTHAAPKFQEELTIVQALPGSRGKAPYNCQKCHKTFDSVESLTRHRFAIHAKRETGTHEIHQLSLTTSNNPMRPCYFCYQWFEDRDDLMKHMEFHIEFASEIN